MAFDRLYQAAYDLLAASTAILGPKAPPRSYVAVGRPALDASCDTLVTWVDLLERQQLSPRSAPGDPGRLVDRLSTGQVHMVYGFCVPTPIDGVLDAAASTARAQEALSVVWELWNGIAQRVDASTLWSGKQKFVAFMPARSYAEQGGMAMWEFGFDVQINGEPGA